MKRWEIDLDTEAVAANVSSIGLDDSLGDRYRPGSGNLELMDEKGSQGKGEEPFDAEASGDALPLLAYAADLVVGEDMSTHLRGIPNASAAVATVYARGTNNPSNKGY